MLLSTARIGDFDRFWQTFSTRGAEKRREHGCKGSRVFRDPDDANRVWVIFDWDPDGFKQFVSDPEVPEIFKEGGVEGRPVMAELAGEHEV